MTRFGGVHAGVHARKKQSAKTVGRAERKGTKLLKVGLRRHRRRMIDDWDDGWTDGTAKAVIVEMFCCVIVDSCYSSGRKKANTFGFQVYCDET